MHAGAQPPTWWMEPDGEAGGRDPPSREFDSPHSPWVCGPATHAAGRDGDLTGLIRPKISGQYGALRLGPGRSPRTVLSTLRVGVSTRGPNHLAPVAQTEEAAGPNPACARSNRVGGTSPVMLGWLSARFVHGSARVRHSPPALQATASTSSSRGTVDAPARRAGADGERPVRLRLEHIGRQRPNLAHYLVVTVP